MALEMFLRMDGVTGTVSNFAHRGWSHISSWQWGLARTQKMTDKGARESLNMNRISIIKPVGLESATLMQLLTDRTVVSSAEISVAPVVGKREAQQKLIGVEFENVLVQSIDTGATIDEEAFCETVVICFGKVKYQYTHNIAAIQGGAEASAETRTFEHNLSTKSNN